MVGGARVGGVDGVGGVGGVGALRGGIRCGLRMFTGTPPPPRRYIVEDDRYIYDRRPVERRAVSDDTIVYAHSVGNPQSSTLPTEDGVAYPQEATSAALSAADVSGAADAAAAASQVHQHASPFTVDVTRGGATWRVTRIS